ncbi:GNAT family N-acetyltransferase [Streptomyces sp. NPDC002054]|uniref:GNAT family N-acetyltransferase n=1 Tax=Streptomyces sp. NPDC002054 TaxID=3154663 RepID=UPI003329E215
MTTTPTPVLRRHTTLTPQLREVIGELYTQVRADLLEHPNYRVEVFLGRLDRHAAEPGWSVVIAYAAPDGEPVGYAYANTVTPGDRWWKRMNSPVPGRFTARDAAAVKEIGVVPAWRGIGVSRQMHDALLAGRGEPHATLMVNPAAGGGKVMRLYEGWGYEEIGVIQPSPDSPWLVCMGCTVRA